MSKIYFGSRVQPGLKQTEEQCAAALCLRRTNLSDDLYGAVGVSCVFQVECEGGHGLGSVGGCIDEYHLLIRPHHPTAFCYTDCCQNVVPYVKNNKTRYDNNSDAINIDYRNLTP